MRSVILSTDMSKAFNSLHPNLLLAKLKAYGLSHPALGLMRSYFDDRENRTRVGNYTSDWKVVKRGCPQGSSLGPLLWNVYQNGLFYTGVASPSNYNLRNSDFHVQRVKTVKYGKHSLRVFGPFLWSKLSMKDRNETSLSRFKANIRRKDLSKLVSDNACKGCHLCDS